MNSKIFAMIAILLMVTATIGAGGTFAQEEGLRKEIKGKRLTHRYNVVFRHSEQLRIGMEAVISYVDELGNDSTKLTEIKGNYVVKVDELKTAAENNDFDGFQQAMKDMRDLVKGFKEESHNTLGDKVGEAKTRVAQAIQDNKEYLDSLIDEINSARGGLELEAIDEALDATEERTEKAEEKGVNVSDIQAKLDEIEQKREDLKAKIDAAVASCAEVGLGICDAPEAQEYKELRQEIKNDFKELKDIARNTGQKNRVSKGMEAAMKVLEKTRERVVKAEERGFDVTAINAKLDEVESSLESAQEKLEAQKYEDSIDELKAARTAFISAIQDFRKLARLDIQGKASERRKGKPNATRQGVEIPVEGGE